MPVLKGYGSFADTDEEVVSATVSRRVISGERSMLIWWYLKPGGQVPAATYPQERMAWVLRGVVDFRMGDDAQVCVPGGVVVVPPGVEREFGCAGEAEVVELVSPPQPDLLS